MYAIENPLRRFRAAFLHLVPALTLFAQVPNPTQRQVGVTTDVRQPIAVFHIDVVSRTMKAINYNHRQGSTNIDFRGTELEPQAKGDAQVDSRMGATKISAHFSHLEPASSFGPEFVTYVLWAVTPEGRPTNLGEVFLNGSSSSIQTSSDLQAFGLMVTAEPYFAVTQPSDVVVMENFVRPDTTGTIEQVDAKFELLKRGVYTRNMSPELSGRLQSDKKVPLDLQEARNAVMIAVNAGAETLAPDTLAKARLELQNAEQYLAGKGDKKALQTVARQATQMAEDARIITLKKIDENEKAAGLEREAEATRKAADETRRREAADAERMQAEKLRTQAESERAAAEAASKRAEKDRAAAETARAEADSARLAALEQQKKLATETANARATADEANRMREQAEKDKIALREQIRSQLNMVLETRDSARGLIVNMSDVLFDTAQYTLKSGAREKLAKVSGILLAHPGLILSVEGHTDSVGSDDYNQTLSDRRANAVRDYLLSQGIPSETVSAKGLGKAAPIASNETSQGRQQNRRVEVVVSGDPIAKELISTSGDKQ